jgi:hypothetical protein
MFFEQPGPAHLLTVLRQPSWLPSRMCCLYIAYQCIVPVLEDFQDYTYNLNREKAFVYKCMTGRPLHCTETFTSCIFIPILDTCFFAFQLNFGAFCLQFGDVSLNFDTLKLNWGHKNLHF